MLNSVCSYCSSAASSLTLPKEESLLRGIASCLPITGVIAYLYNAKTNAQALQAARALKENHKLNASNLKELNNLISKDLEDLEAALNHIREMAATMSIKRVQHSKNIDELQRTVATLQISSTSSEQELKETSQKVNELCTAVGDAGKVLQVADESADRCMLIKEKILSNLVILIDETETYHSTLTSLARKEISFYNNYNRYSKYFIFSLFLTTAAIVILVATNVFNNIYANVSMIVPVGIMIVITVRVILKMKECTEQIKSMTNDIALIRQHDIQERLKLEERVTTRSSWHKAHVLGRILRDAAEETDRNKDVFLNQMIAALEQYAERVKNGESCSKEQLLEIFSQELRNQFNSTQLALQTAVIDQNPNEIDKLTIDSLRIMANFQLYKVVDKIAKFVNRLVNPQNIV